MVCHVVTDKKQALNPPNSLVSQFSHKPLGIQRVKRKKWPKEPCWDLPDPGSAENKGTVRKKNIITHSQQSILNIAFASEWFTVLKIMHRFITYFKGRWKINKKQNSQYFWHVLFILSERQASYLCASQTHTHTFLKNIHSKQILTLIKWTSIQPFPKQKDSPLPCTLWPWESPIAACHRVSWQVCFMTCNGGFSKSISVLQKFKICVQ